MFEAQQRRLADEQIRRIRGQVPCTVNEARALMDRNAAMAFADGWR